MPFHLCCARPLRSAGEAPQAQRIGRHRHRAERHGRPGEHRVEQDPNEWIECPRRHRDQDRIVEKRPEEVLAGRLHGAPAQPDGRGHSGQTIAQQGDIGGLDRHIGASPLRDPHIRLRQGRSFVRIATVDDRRGTGCETELDGGLSNGDNI
jgi:hypothetical protein